jgi:Zn-dependent protease
MNMDTITLASAWYAVFVISLSFHEAAHAFVAFKLGDRTAYEGGQVSLHPFVHMAREPIGMIVVPLVSFFFNGWMMGWASAPYDPEWARRHPKHEMFMAAAGPLANLILVLLAAIIIRVGIGMGYFHAPDSITFSRVTEALQPGWANSIAVMASILFTLNLVLFIFNLLPVPPLDGSCLVPMVLSSENAHRWKTFISNPTCSIIGLVLAWRFFGYIFDPVQIFALNLLYPGAHYGM